MAAFLDISSTPDILLYLLSLKLRVQTLQSVLHLVVLQKVLHQVENIYRLLIHSIICILAGYHLISNFKMNILRNSLPNFKDL